MGIINSRLKLRSDTSINWSLSNSVLLEGEIGYDSTNNLFKIGDGASTWNSLSYTSWHNKQGNCVTTNASDTAGRFTITLPEVLKYEDGLTITIFLSQSYNSSYNTININGLGPKVLYFRYNSRLTSHFGTGSILTFTYKEEAGRGYTHDGITSDKSGFICGTSYDTSNYTNLNCSYTFTNSNLPIYRYKLFALTSEHKAIPLSVTNITSPSSTDSREINTAAFNPFLPIYYYASSGTIQANATVSHMWLKYNIDPRYTFDDTSTKFIVSGLPVFLVLSINSDGSASQVATSSGSNYTTSIPLESNGLVYKYIGYTINSSTFSLNLAQPCFKYKDGKIIEYTGLQLVNADWNATSGDAQILNKPNTLVGYGIVNAYTKTEVDNLLKNISYNDLLNKPTIDSSFSTSSTNALQNRIITNEFNRISTNYVPYTAVIQNTNPFGGKKLYNQALDNAFYAADKRFYVTITWHSRVVDSISYPINTETSTNIYSFTDSPVLSTASSAQNHTIFNQFFEGGLNIPQDQYAKIHIQFVDPAADSNPTQSSQAFPGYPYGTYYLNYYYTMNPYANTQYRCYNAFAAHTVGWHLKTSSITGSGSGACIETIADGGNYWRTQLEFIVFGRTTSDPTQGAVSLTQLSWFLDRPKPVDASYINKYNDDDSYNTITFHDKTNSVDSTTTVGPGILTTKGIDILSALNGKQDTLTTSNGISIVNNTIANTGVLSVQAGSTNGSIAVNTNGTTTNVSVTGLGSNAFTNIVYAPKTDVDSAIANEASARKTADATLQTNIDTKATDSAVVHKEGAETIPGTKLFTSTDGLQIKDTNVSGASGAPSILKETTKAIQNTATPVLNINKKTFFEGGAVFNGTAAAAGLVTRGISGCATDGNQLTPLWLNYRGQDTYNSNTYVYLSGVGENYIAARRGDFSFGTETANYVPVTFITGDNNSTTKNLSLSSHTHNFDSLTDIPNTLAGHKITNAYTKEETTSLLGDKQSTSLKGEANGYASLDNNGKVPASQLPAYVDDIVEYANVASFPTLGESGKIYVALDTNLTYRWTGTGSNYVEISPSIALGETSSTAYAGDKGKAVTAGLATEITNRQTADTALSNSLQSHINSKNNPHSVTKVQVGLGNVDNTSDINKPISTATQTALNTKQATLISTGDTQNIKTVGSQSLLGSGDIAFKTVGTQSLLGTGNISIPTNVEELTGGSNIVHKSSGLGTAWIPRSTGADSIAPWAFSNDILPDLKQARTNIGNPSLFELAFLDKEWTNKFEFFDPANLTIETSTDDITFTDAGVTEAEKKTLMGGDANAAIRIPHEGYLRLTFDNPTNSYTYVYLNALYLYHSTAGSTESFKIEKYNFTSAAWTNITDGYTNTINNWPGHTVIRHEAIPYRYPPNTSATHFSKVRLTIKESSRTNTNYYAYLYKLEWWGGYPAGRRNIYSTDSNKNVSFPGNVSVSGKFIGNVTGNVTGNADTATTANTVVNATFTAAGGGKSANNILSNGLYYYQNDGPTYKEINISSDGSIYCQAYNSSYISQIAQSYRSGELWVRGKAAEVNSGAWQSWTKIIDTRDLESVTASATTTAAGTSATAIYTAATNSFTFGIPKGDKGDTGATGAKGDTGLQGIQGPKGDTGATGAKGDQGIQGPKGDKGDKGDIGPQGNQGPKGEQGIRGERGYKGDTGEIGPRGVQGPKGEQGIRGERGYKGDPGPKGDKGDKGEKGDKGAKGDTGDSGILSFTNTASGNVVSDITYNSTTKAMSISKTSISYATPSTEGILFGFTENAGGYGVGLGRDDTTGWDWTTTSAISIGMDYSASAKPKGFNSIAIGNAYDQYTGPTSSGALSIAIGSSATNEKTQATGSRSIAIGTNAVASNTSSIQLLSGTNSTESSIKLLDSFIPTMARPSTDATFGTVRKIWVGTLAEYNALSTKDANTVYLCK